MDLEESDEKEATHPIWKANENSSILVAEEGRCCHVAEEADLEYACEPVEKEQCEHPLPGLTQ